MWKKVKNLDLFIRVVDKMTNKYVCYPSQYHRDYWSFTLTFSFEDWSNFHNDGKQHIEITAEYVNAKGQFLVKFQDADFDKLCEKIKIWNESHRVEMTADIVKQICDEQEAESKKQEVVPVTSQKTLPIQIVEFRPQDTVESEEDEDDDEKNVLFVDLLHWLCDLVVKPFTKNK